MFLESVAAGLVANGGTSAFAMIARRRNKQGFVDDASGRLETPLSRSGRDKLRKWIGDSDSACWASKESLAECLRRQGSDKADELAAALWTELLRTQLSPHDQILLAAGKDAAEGAALAAEGVADIHSRLDLGRSSLNPFPADALDLPCADFFPSDWEEIRAEVLQEHGDVTIEAAAGTSVLRFVLHLEHAVFVSRIVPTLTDDLQKERPAFVVLWKPTDGLVDDLRLIRQHHAGLDFRIVAIEPSLLTTASLYRLPSVSRATLSPVLATLLTDLNSVDAVLRAAPGRSDLALGLANDLGEDASIASRRADWIHSWASDYVKDRHYLIEFEAALALIAVLGEVDEEELPVVADLCGLTLPALESAILVAESDEILARRSVLGDDLRHRTTIKVAMPALIDSYLQAYWRDRRFGLPASIRELIDAFPNRAGTIFEIASDAASRGINVRSADVDFVVSALDGSEIDLQTKLYLLGCIAPQSSAIAALAIRRANELIEQAGGLAQANFNDASKIGFSGAAYNLREGWDLLVRSLSSGHRLSDEDRQGLEALLRHNNLGSMRPAAIKAVLAQTTTDGCSALTCGLVEMAIETEWTRFARDIRNEGAFRVSRQTMSIEELETIRGPLLELADDAVSTCPEDSSDSLLRWASSMASFSSHDHSGCCGREIPNDVRAESRAIAVELLAVVAAMEKISPRVAQRHNDIAGILGVPPVSVNIGDGAKLLLTELHCLPDGPELWLPSPEDSNTLVDNPEAIELLEQRRLETEQRIVEWVEALEPESAYETICKAIDEASEMPMSSLFFTGPMAFDALVRIADPSELLETVAPEPAAHLNVSALIHRIAHECPLEEQRRALLPLPDYGHIRHCIIRVALTGCLADEPLAIEIRSQIGGDDLRSLFGFGSFAKVDASRLGALLNHPDPVVRGAASLEFSLPDTNDGVLKRVELPIDHAVVWRDEVLAIDDDRQLGAPLGKERLLHALLYIQSTSPVEVINWIAQGLESDESEIASTAASMASRLTGEDKRRILVEPGQDGLKHQQVNVLLEYGSVAWVAEAIDAGEIAGHDVAASIPPFDLNPGRLEEFAALLLPRGVEPETLAQKVVNYVGTDARGHYSRLYDYYGARHARLSEENQLLAEFARLAQAYAAQQCEHFEQIDRNFDAGEYS